MGVANRSIGGSKASVSRKRSPRLHPWTTLPSCQQLPRRLSFPNSPLKFYEPLPPGGSVSILRKESQDSFHVLNIHVFVVTNGRVCFLFIPTKYCTVYTYHIVSAIHPLLIHWWALRLVLPLGYCGISANSKHTDFKSLRCRPRSRSCFYFQLRSGYLLFL